MDRLAFEHITKIEEQLSDEYLISLVAIFSNLERNDLLLTYLPGKEPDIDLLPPHVIITSLKELDRFDLRTFDGPIITFSAMSVILRDVSTKGRNCFGLDNILRKRKMFDQLYRTWAELGHYLLDVSSKRKLKSADSFDSKRTIAYIIALMGPTILSRLSRQGLVALAPCDGLKEYVQNGSCRAIYADPVEAEAWDHNVKICSLSEAGKQKYLSENDCIIALEEVVELLQPKEKLALFFTELRFALRKSNLDSSLNSSLRGLANYYYERFVQERRPQDLETAYSLAVEIWLSLNPVDDLVAVLPSNDFEEFLKSGKAIYVYRNIHEASQKDAPDGVQYRSLKDLDMQKFTLEGLGRMSFSLPLIQPKTKAGNTVEWGNLGPLLYKADNTKAMARSSWLLVRDMLNWPRADLDAVKTSFNDLSRVILYDCEIFSLLNPWSWRQGRYTQTIESLYETLKKVLERQVEISQDAEPLYYEALLTWHMLWELTDKHDESSPEELDNEDVKSALGTIFDLLTDFERKSQHLKGAVLELRKWATPLQAVCSSLRIMLSGGAQPNVVISDAAQELESTPSSIHMAIRSASEMIQQPAFPSAFFRTAFRQYAQIAEEIESISISSSRVEDKIKDLRWQIIKLKKERRLVFALYHEEPILHLLYDQAIKRTEQYAEELKGSAQLLVRLKTPSVWPHQDNNLTFEVKNIGNAWAESIKVELKRSDRFNLMEKSSVKDVALIRPRASRTFSFKIFPEVDDDFQIAIKLSYHDQRSDRQERLPEWLLVKVDSLDKGPIVPKMNPYRLGAHIKADDYEVFYGRRKEIQSLLSGLAADKPQSYILYGARRTGKTSVLHMLDAIIGDRNEYKTRSHFGIPDDWYAALDSLEPILINLQGELLTSGDDFFRMILRKIASKGLAVDAIKTILAEPINPNSLQKFFDQEFDKSSARRPLLLIDEFDIVEPFAGKHFYDSLRTVIAGAQGFRWIIANAWELYKQNKSYASPFFNLFDVISLGRLDEVAAIQLILDPWRTQSSEQRERQAVLQFKGEAVDIILRESGCHPYFIQLICTDIVDYVNSKPSNYVKPDDVYAVIDGIVTTNSAASNHISYIWEESDYMAKVILLVMLDRLEPLSFDELMTELQENARRYEIHLSKSQIDKKLKDSKERLLAMGVISESTSHQYEWGIPMFRRLLEVRREREDLWLVPIQQLKALLS